MYARLGCRTLSCYLDQKSNFIRYSLHESSADTAQSLYLASVEIMNRLVI